MTRLNTAPPKRLLVVDDEKDVVEAVQYLFEDEGYEVVVSTDVTDALAKAAQGEFSAAVLDASMGAGNLCIVADCLRTGVATSHVPIIILSGLSEEAVRASFDRYDLFVRKDADLTDLVTQVGAIIDRQA